MIKATELRIGNLVDYEYTIHVVSGILTERVIQSYWLKGNNPNEFYDTLIEDLSPIPLTEEWLVKFGLIQNANFREFWHLYLIDERVEIIFQTPYMTCELCMNELGVKIELKYVHSLQNLYYSLRGKELILIK